MEWSNFDSVFRSKGDYVLDQKQIDSITQSRKEHGGILYFDKICNSIGLKQPQKIYPPKTNSDLRSLWQKVAKAEVSDEKKQAVLFYVLKDCKHPSGVDNSFAQKVYLPFKYQTLIAGLWELDHLQFSRALEYLTDPCLTPEFADDILLTLLRRPQCDQALAMAYNLTVRPPLAKQQTLEAYFELLVKTNIIEAYHFCKTMDKSKHKVLFEKLLQLVHEEEPSSSKAKRTTLLLSLPFTDEEEQWYEEYLLHGHGSKTQGAKDSILMRRLTMGKSLSGPGALDRYRGQRIHDVNWDDIRLMEQDLAT